jgi:hypothetical protein
MGGHWPANLVAVSVFWDGATAEKALPQMDADKN